MTAPLRIGVDARELLGETTGVGRYLGELMRRWTNGHDVGCRFILYSPEPLQSLQTPRSPDLTASAKATASPPKHTRRREVGPTGGSGIVEQRVGGRGTGTLWEQTWLRWTVQRDRPDVFFAPAYTAPLGLEVPVGVMIHDISFIAHPEWFRIREGARRRWLTRRTAETAAVIFTPSRFSRDEIRRHLRVDERRIRVIPQGISPRVTAAGRTRSAQATHDGIVLYVGSVFNRRRVPDLIAAFARATPDLPHTRLVIVGDNRTWPPQDLKAVADTNGVGARTEFLDYVADSELAALYGRASVFAFLSEYEGFGFTPLEALAAGVPPVLLDTPVAREVCGDAAVYVARDDVAGTAAVLRRFLTDPAAGEDVLRHGPAVLARYSWDRTAAQTLDYLKRIAAR
jgi:glycosyltransferase involved in cell wall biosynthesis